MGRVKFNVIISAKGASTKTQNDARHCTQRDVANNIGHSNQVKCPLIELTKQCSYNNFKFSLTVVDQLHAGRDWAISVEWRLASSTLN